MSKKLKNPSNKEHEDQSISSVFDFLYYDKKRVASFLSQFNNFGHLKELTEGEKASRSKSENTSGGISSGIPTVISGETGHEAGTGASYSNDSQRIYDPTWTNALNFLDHLQTNKLLVRKIEEASIGQFVLHNGELTLLDLALIEKTWKLPSVEKIMKRGNVKNSDRASRRRAKKAGYQDNSSEELNLFIDLMGILPHTTQARITNSDDIAWCNLIEDSLTISSNDITLKHGQTVPGEWNIVGILDAKPDIEEDEKEEPDFADPEELGAKLMQVMAPIVRNFLGRPHESYGITPILIFREVKN